MGMGKKKKKTALQAFHLPFYLFTKDNLKRLLILKKLAELKLQHAVNHSLG